MALFPKWRSSTLLDGAGSRIRTDDLLITNQLLYQLSYAGEKEPRRLPYKAAVNKLLAYSRTREYAESGSAVSKFLMTVLRYTDSG
jgi:hypothetical protein